MRLDIFALSVVTVLALSALLYIYAHSISTMENFDVQAWALAEDLADEWARGGEVAVSGARVRITDVIRGRVLYEGGLCVSVLGYAYTFRVVNNTLCKIEVWYCSPP